MTEDTTTSPKAPTRRVHNFIDADQLRKDMAFTITDLSTGMVQQSSLLVHYGMLASKSSRQVDDFKLLLETTEAKVYRLLRDEFVKIGDKFTEKQLENAVATDKRVINLKRCLNEAKQIEANAKIAVEGFRHRRDMLVQQGLLSREEMKGEVFVNRRQAAEGEIEVLKQRYIDRNVGAA